MGYGATIRQGGALILSKLKKPIWKRYIVYDSITGLSGQGRTVETVERPVVAGAAGLGGGWVDRVTEFLGQWKRFV